MRSKTSILFILAVIFSGLIFLTGYINKKESMVRHVVVFKYKAGTTPAQIKQVTDGFRGLKEKIPGIVSFEEGQNNSPEKHNKGFNHVYLVTFDSEKSRDQYLPHPDHDKFGALLGQLKVVEDVFVVDFTSSK